jgi:hypothetical protein
MLTYIVAAQAVLEKSNAHHYGSVVLDMFKDNAKVKRKDFAAKYAGKAHANH